MGSVLSLLSYSEFIRLIISLSFDVVEYVIPVLMLPLIGDLYDIFGLVTSLYLYGVVGAISVLDLVPGLDILPINTITWFVWLTLKRQRESAERLLGKEF